MAACGDMGKWDGMMTRRDTGFNGLGNLFSSLLVGPVETFLRRSEM
jgi:hypothetical protein